MVAVRMDRLFLTMCILEALWLLVAQVLGNTIILLACLACFLLLSVWAAIKGMALPVLMFFLPFSSLVKLQPGTISFFTLAMLAVFAVCALFKSKNVSVYHFIPVLVLAAQTLLVKTLTGTMISNQYMMFMAALLLVPYLVREVNGNYDFHWLTVFFSLGIIMAALSSQYLLAFPSIRQYIDTTAMIGSTTRVSGFFGDPNFYSAHITAALGGALAILIEGEDKKRTLSIVVIIALLVYCGMLSISKSFMLVAICLFVFWFIGYMFKKGKMSTKITVILTLMIGAGFLLSSTVFVDMFDALVARFGRDSNISDFTTGRTELWASYLREFEEDPLLLFFGKGYSSVLVNDRASHNTILQAVFQFGLVGCIILLVWFVYFTRTWLKGLEIRSNKSVQAFIVLIGSFGPWMAIDILFLDEFFLIPIYVGVAMLFLFDKSLSEKEPA